MVGIVVQVGVVALVAGIGMAMVRMVRGPEVADRVLAADVLSLEVVGLVILLAFDQKRSLSLDPPCWWPSWASPSTLAFPQIHWRDPFGHRASGRPGGFVDGHCARRGNRVPLGSGLSFISSGRGGWSGSPTPTTGCTPPRSARRWAYLGCWLALWCT
ncbi:MAG: hypothetical protein Ct9H300mP31_03360 [Acidimicrobiaceae bacterium]|nr:MAG: hypothetical protein Ct9H300mP31_03360 [Acidimicrobiaceae bacterium]